MPQRPMARINTCPCLLPYVLECPAASHSNNSRSAFSTIVPSKCPISNTIQMRRPRRRMRAPLPRPTPLTTYSPLEIFPHPFP